MLEEVHPLKQGLKHDQKAVNELIEKLEEVHPLKQGLKLNGRTLRYRNT